MVENNLGEIKMSTFEQAIAIKFPEYNRFLTNKFEKRQFRIFGTTDTVTIEEEIKQGGLADVIDVYIRLSTPLTWWQRLWSKHSEAEREYLGTQLKRALNNFIVVW